MKMAKTSFRELLSDITPEERAEARLSFQISNRLDLLMKERAYRKNSWPKAWVNVQVRLPAGSVVNIKSLSLPSQCSQLFLANPSPQCSNCSNDGCDSKTM